MFRKYTGSIIAAGIILLGGLLTSANSETINFVWEGKDFNVSINGKQIDVNPVKLE